MSLRPCDKANGFPVEHKVSLGAGFKIALPTWYLPMSLAFGMGTFQMKSSSWVCFLSVDCFVTYKTASSERGPPSLKAPSLALAHPPLRPYPLSPRTSLSVVENYTFTNCVSFFTPTIFPHRDRFWNELMDESCRYPAVYRSRH